MKKKYQQPLITTMKIEQPLLNTVSGEGFNPTVTPSDEEAV